MMRKEVKRALLLWPAAASAAVVAASVLPPLWFGPAGHLNRQHQQSIGESARTPSVSSPDLSYWDSSRDVPDDFARLETERCGGYLLVERPRRGRRGLPTPLAMRPAIPTGELNSESLHEGVLLAPVIDPIAELAGYADTDESSGQQPLPTFPLIDPSNTPDALSENTPDRDTHRLQRWTENLSGGIKSKLPGALTTAVGRTGELVSGVLRRWQPAAADTSAGLSTELRGGTHDGAPGSKTREAEARAVSRSLLPPSVGTLAKPVAPRRTLPVAPQAWPRAKQLHLQLATLTFNRQDSDVEVKSTPIPRTNFVGDTGSYLARRISSGDQPETIDRQGNGASTDSWSAVMTRWAERVDDRLDTLQQLPRIGDPEGGEVLRELSVLAEAGLQIAEKVQDRDQQVRWLTTAHSLARRVSIWASVWELNQRADASPKRSELPYTFTVSGSPNSENADNGSLQTVIRQVQDEVASTGDPSGWQAFLMLPQIRSLAAIKHPSGADLERRALVAQRVLSRLNYHGLDSRHRAWLDRDSVIALAKRLRDWSAKPVDYVQLLEDLERQEADAIDLVSLKVTDAFQSLRYSDDLASARVAKAIDVNYRNANLRTAISDQLLDRLMPEVPTETTPVRTKILGSDVRGISRTRSELGLQLRPSEDSWNLLLETDGQVATTSRASQSGVTVHTTGQNQFEAQTPIQIRPDGVLIGDSRVAVRGGNQIRGIDTRFDGWPLLGPLVRSIVESRATASQPIAQGIANRRVGVEVTSQLESQLTRQTDAATQRFDEIVLGPLGRLNLNPRVIDLETTDQRLIARYRVAGDWQLAAHTPRPRALSDSWMSLQVHQSAINNTLEQLLPRGDTKTFQQLFDETLDLFGQPREPLPDDVPADAAIQFATTRPITVEMEDDTLWLTFRVVELSQPGSRKLTKFIVRAAYKPVADGLQAHLIRDGHLRISGPGMSMRERLPVRAIFNKVLAEDRPLPLTADVMHQHPALDGLAVTQLEIRDGWLALAIGPSVQPRVARRP